VPDDWQLVSAPGLTLRVPPNWPVDELGPDEPRPGACGFAGMTGRVTRALGTSDVAVRCPLTVSVLVPPSDGVWVYELRPDESVPADESLPIIDRIVSTGDHRYLVRVGFGVDGTIGRIPVLGFLVVILLRLAFFLAALALSILGFTKAMFGEEWRIPYLDDLADRVPIE